MGHFALSLIGLKTVLFTNIGRNPPTANLVKLASRNN